MGEEFIERVRRSHIAVDADLAKAFIVGSSVDEHIARIEEAFDARFDHVFVSSNSPNEERFIEEYKTKVVPYFKDRTF
jgi:hypothetical protein